MITRTEHPHVEKVDGVLDGEPVIAGTRIPVRAVVEYWRMGVRPEEILTYYPSITLAQVFDALSYYGDHPDEIQAHIAWNQVAEDLIHPLVRDLP